MKKSFFLLTAGFLIFAVLEPLQAFGQDNGMTSSGSSDSSPASLSSAGVEELKVSDDIPDLLAGVWQGKDRLVLFGKDGNEFAAVLRVFYAWYNDRAAEPASYAEYSTRDRNNTTSRKAEQIEIKYITLAENESHTAGAYELRVLYPGEKAYTYVPVAVIGGNIYLDFLVKGSASEVDRQHVLTSISKSTDERGEVTENLNLEGFWRDCGAASGLLVFTVTLALKNIHDGDALSYEDCHQSFQHTEISLVTQYSLDGPVKADIIIIVCHTIPFFIE